MTISSVRNPLRLSALVLAMYPVFGGVVWALPQGATVVNGQVVASRPTPGTLQINASNGAIINWQKFSIGAGEVTRFVQPDRTSSVLNRVVGNEASHILGQLQSNGRVFLINPLGIVIGGGARIDTNSFIASTLNLSDADFLAGRLRFMAGAQAGGISNAGYISAGPGGSIALIAPDVTNTGIIHAPDGNILLAAGRRLEIASTDLEGVSFEIQAPADQVLNLGQLLAENGAIRVFAASLRHSGSIRAERMTQDADGSVVLVGRDSVTLTAESTTSASGLSGGRVLVQSEGGTTRVAGAVTATGAQDQGGQVHILGDRVAIETTARIDASGQTGGGQILVGGDFQGNNAAIQNASKTSVAQGAVLAADALGTGDGGRVVVWADEDTRFAGSLQARGGQTSGDGGFAEVSGKRNLSFTGQADLSATQGQLGGLLLDPLDIVVSSGSGILPTVVDEFADFDANVVTISPAKLSALAANVTLQAERDVYVKDAIALGTSGAGLTITAGGTNFNAGQIYLEDLGVSRPGGIFTTAGAVTLRGLSVQGPGAITTNGGAVDILTSGALNYTGAITSGGGAVTLGSQSGGVNNANVNAGSGAIQATGSSVSGGSYTTSGTATLTATSGSVSVYDIQAGVANLSATSNVNVYVDVSERVNATSSGSYVSLYNTGAGPLRLGTLSSPSGLYLSSSTGLEQAVGGVLGSPYLQLYTYSSLTSAGTLANPLFVEHANPVRVDASGLAAPVHLHFGATTVVDGLGLAGTVAALGASTVSGSSNITQLALGSTAGALDLSVSATGGFGNRLSLTVSDGGITAPTIDLQGGGGADLTAAGPVLLGNVTTTRSSGTGFEVYTQRCDYYAYVACADTSPITVSGYLNAGTGGVRLETNDNGDIAIPGALTAGNVYLRTGYTYATSYGYPYSNQVTSNNITLGTVTNTGSFRAYNYGEGNIQINSLTTTGYVDMYAGSSYNPTGSPNPYISTNNQITVGVVEPLSSSNYFQISNSGIGDVTVTGAINRSGGTYIDVSQGNLTTQNISSANDSISLSASGNVATGHLTSATYDVSVDAGGTLTVGNVTSGSAGTYGNVTLNAGSDLVFGKINTAGYTATYYGHVNLSSNSGAVQTSVDDTAADITATGNVSVQAGGRIGSALATNPLDIRSGTAGAVTLHAGTDIGSSPSQAVKVDTASTLSVTSTGGTYHVAATDGSTEKAIASIRLSASASGIGNGNTATFRSSGLDVDALSDGTTLIIGDPGQAGSLAQAAGVLNEFRFDATGGSALVFGDVAFTTTGYNQLYLSADQGLTQAAGQISAGHTALAGGAGNVLVGDITVAVANGNRIDISGADITTGNLSAPALGISGANLYLGSVTTNGTYRGAYNGGSYVYVPREGVWRYVLDDLVLNASGNINTTGAVTSATSALLTAGGDIAVAGGTGAVTAGNTAGSYHTDTARVWAGLGSGLADTGAISGYAVNLRGHTTDTGALTAVGSATVSGTDLVTGAINASGITLTGTTFNTGNLTSSGGLTVYAAAGYAPTVDISAASATIQAAGDINIGSGNRLNANSVNLSTTNDGNITAHLRGTTSLTLNTDRGFAVDVQDSLLSNITVTTASDKALGMGSVGARVYTSSPEDTIGGASHQTFELTSTDLNLTRTIGTENDVVGALNLQYTDVSAVAMPSGLAVNFDYPAGGSFNVYLASDTAVTTEVSVGNTVFNTSTAGHFTLQTGGDLLLRNLATHGGHINATTRTGDIDVGGVSSSAAGGSGNVTLTANLGDIEANDGQIYTASTFSGTSFVETSHGTVTLNAPGGSIGGLFPLSVAYADALHLNAPNAINIYAGSGNLSSLSLTTTASGTGTLTVTDNPNFSGFSLVRNAGNLDLGALTATNGASLSITNTSGGIHVAGNQAGLNNLSLDARAGDITVQAQGLGATRSVAVTGTLTLNASNDVKVEAGSATTENVVLTGANVQIDADRDILVTAAGGNASVNATGASTQTLRAGRDLVLQGGSATGAAALIGSEAYSQNLYVGRNLSLLAGTGDGASAKLAQTYANGVHYQSAQVGGDVVLQAGNATSGQGANAYAQLSGGQQSFGTIGGQVSVLGGNNVGNYASLVATYGQQVGSPQGGSSGTITDAVTVTGGSGSGAYARIAALGGAQSVYAGLGSNNTGVSGDILVTGGSGSGAYAEISSAAGQTVGSQAFYCYYAGCYNPTQAITLTGGMGNNAYAAIKAAGSQGVYGGGAITVQGGGGSAAYAEIATTAGSQTVGSSSTSSNDATDSIRVAAGEGGVARIQATGNQALYTGGDLTLTGGSTANMTASVETTGGFQTIGYTYIYSNDPLNNILLQAGGATGAAVWLRAATGQNIDAGGSINLVGTQAGAFADVSTSGGTQTIGNVNGFSYDQTDSITLQGGVVAGAYAQLGSGGSQNIRSAGDITLTGGIGSGSAAMVKAVSGQTVTTLGDLLITGGENTGTGLNATGLRNQTSGNQTVNVSGDWVQVNGTGAADTWVYQTGTGIQNLTVGGNLQINSPHASGAVNSIEAFGSSQALNVGGQITIDNQNGWVSYIAAHNGPQTVTADSMVIALAGAQGGAFAGVATGTGQNQTVVLTGDGTTAGTATLSITNLNATSGSRAALSSGGDMTLRVTDSNYDTAGAVTVGSTSGLGKTDITATGSMDFVAGSLAVQGGANAAATAEFNATNTMNVSTLYGSVTLLGGASGPASIDPTLLSVVSNGNVFMQAGANSTANTNINAGTFNLASTSGDLSLNNSTFATSTINATTFNYTGPGSVNLNGGTITTIGASTIDIAGVCNNCTTNLIGPFSVTAFTPPPIDFAALVAGDVVTLTDANGMVFEMVVEDDGTITINRRSVNQCF